MFPTFFEAVGKTLGSGAGETLVARLFGATTLFWGSGILAYLWVCGSPDLSKLDTVTQLTWLGAGLITIIMSEAVMQWFTLPLLRLLEGYHWPGFLRRRVTSGWQKKIDQKNRTWQELGQIQRLAQKKSAELTNDEKTRLGRAQQQQPDWARRRSQTDIELAAYPAKMEHLAPTRLGNLLIAAEQHPSERYGLEAITIWPRLWLILPENAQKELSAARSAVDRAIQLTSCGMLLVIWTPVMCWLRPLTPTFSMAFLLNVLAYGLPVFGACVITVLGYQWRTLPAASLYGNLIRSAFDLYRFELYKQMKWPLPAKNSEERQQGEELTRCILRGYTRSVITFEQPRC